MRGLPLLVSLTFLIALLAGCAQQGDPGASSTSLDPDVDVKPTETTGIIKGVVVDLTIKPLAQAIVTVKAAGKTLTNTTNANGGFGFEGLEPGTYFISASKVGFKTSQTSVEVIANQADVPTTRLTLESDGTFVKPYAQLVKFEGFLGCGSSIAVITVNICTTVNNIQEGTFHDVCCTRVTMNAVPFFVQAELTWDDNQPTPQRFNLATFSTGEDGESIDQTQGPSPIIKQINATAIEDSNLGNGTDLGLNVFASGSEVTVVCDPTNSNFGGLLIQNCTYGSGLTFEQPFEIYTTVFYGFTPKEGWMFLVDGEHPSPP